MKLNFKLSEVFLLHEIVIRLDRLARQTILEERGVTYQEFLVMMSARELPTPTQDDVAQYLDISRSSVSQRVSSLLEKQLVLQVQDKSNRRKVNLSLTPQGAELLSEIYSLMLGATEEVFASLGPQREPFQQALLQIIRLLE